MEASFTALGLALTYCSFRSNLHKPALCKSSLSAPSSLEHEHKLGDAPGRVGAGHPRVGCCPSRSLLPARSCFQTGGQDPAIYNVTFDPSNL